MESYKIISSRKSRNQSDLFRLEGNKQYADRHFYDALILYNKSLCYAEESTEALSTIYANRSAVYFESHLYEECLNNIKLATNNATENQMKKLSQRKQMCLDKLNNKQKVKHQCVSSSEFLKLSDKANGKIPFIIDCLQVESNDKFGRFVTASMELKVGTVIAIEEPYLKVLKPSVHYNRCSFCLEDKLLDLFPCSGCASVMFCSTECQDKALKQYHYYECEIMELLLQSEDKHFSIRAFLKALFLFDGVIEDLEDFLSENDNNQTVFDFDMSFETPQKHKNSLLAANSLSKSHQLPTDDYTEIFQNSRLNGMWNTHEEFIKNFLLNQTLIGNSSSHTIMGWPKKKNYRNDIILPSQLCDQIGSGIYPFHALLNHSCAPNVTRTFFGDKMFLIVCRTILKDEQLFDSYRGTSYFCKTKKAERQSSLLNDYGFICDCIACSMNFPIIAEQKIVNESLLRFAQMAFSELITLSLADSIVKFKDYCVIIDENRHNFPSIEINILIKCLSSCLTILSMKPGLELS